VVHSENLLSGVRIDGISGFRATSTLPPGTAARISFSQDKASYYSASGTLAGWTSLADGGNYFDLSGLGWTDASFYYRVRLEAIIDPAVQPKLNEVQLVYAGEPAPDLPAGGYEWSGVLLSSDLLASSTEELSGFERFGWNISYLPYGTTIKAQFSTDGATWYSSGGVAWSWDDLSAGNNTFGPATLPLTFFRLRDAGAFYYKLKINQTLDSNSTPVLLEAGIVDAGNSFTGGAGAGNAARFGTSSPYCVPGSSDYCAAPVGEWKFDEKQGAVARDTSGNGNDGAITGASWDMGKFGTGIKIDARGENIEIADSPALSFGNGGTDSPFSLSFRVKKATEDVIILANKENEWHCQFGSNNEFSFGIFSNDYNGAKGLILSDLVSGSDGWFHLAITYDGSKSASGIKLYSNGIIGESGEDSYGSYTGMSNSNEPIIIGDQIGTQDFKAVIDDFKIYNYARTPAQIAWEYNGGKPIVHWRFDECQGSVIHDNSGNSLHGTLNLGASGVTSAGSCTSSSNSFWYNGRIGHRAGSGSFDGVDDYVNGGSDSIIDNLSAYTTCAWIKPGSKIGDIVTKTVDGSSGSWFLSFTQRSSQWVLASWRNTNSTMAEAISYLGAVQPGQWAHVCSSFDYSKNGYITLYINAEEPNYYSHIAASGTLVNESNYDLWIGSSLASDYFDGQIDEVKIFNYALTPEQVKTEYSGGAMRFK